MDELQKLLQDTKDLSPKARRELLLPRLSRGDISRIFHLLLAGKEQRAFLRLLCDLAPQKEMQEIIQHNIKLHPEAFPRLLQSEDPKVRKTCAQLLGRVCPDAFAPHLLHALAAEKTDFVRPSILLALGNARHAEGVREALRAFVIPEGDEKQVKEQQLALQKALSSLSSLEKPALPLAGACKGKILYLSCPNARVTALEMQELGFSPSAPDHPRGYLSLQGVPSLEQLFEARTFFDAGFFFGKFDSLSSAVEAVSSHKLVGEVESLYGRSDLTYRVETICDFEPMGQKERKATAEAIAVNLGTSSRLQNSPSAYSLEIRLIVSQKYVYVLLVPACGELDARFTYRAQAISASIHPAVAASCVYFCKSYLKENAHILDCFCGSGTMLFERARYPYRSLTGTDISHPALKAARANERLARTGAHFLIKNAVTPFEKRYDEVICNMPFGLRVSSHGENRRLYMDFLDNLARTLAPGGTAFLFTHEKKLIAGLLKNKYRLLERKTFAAGGLYPSMFIVQRISDH